MHSSTKLLVIDEVEYLPLDSTVLLLLPADKRTLRKGSTHATSNKNLGMGRAAGDPGTSNGST